MILVFDTLGTGVHHVPFNSGMLQTLRHALPGQTIRVHADPSHLTELRGDRQLVGSRAIEFCDIVISPHYQAKSQVVSVRRFWRELMTLWAALRRVPSREKCLLVLLNATSTCMFAASLVARSRPGKVGVVVCLHGNVETLTGWRSRNPAIRRFDLRGVLSTPQTVPFRYLVLEESIKAELGGIVPEALPAVEVLPHPANPDEIAGTAELTLQLPIRVGLIGQATEAKGISPFLETANLLKQRYGERIEFYLIGRVFPGTDVARFAALDGPVSTERLSREQFRTLLGRVHFAFLPLQPSYYRLAASGALLDAITWLKPVVATAIPIVADLFERYGDIGYQCHTTEDMQQALQTVLTEMDPARYRDQVQAVRRIRDARLPAALAEPFRAILRDFFPDILRAESS